MSIDINQLHTAVWIYDIDHYAIVWANQAALELWQSPSLDELTQRDLKTGLSAAVQESLLQYRQAFEQGQVIQENWAYSPKGKDTKAFCQFSGYRLNDGRIAMLVEATPSNLLHSSLQINATTILSTYNANGEFISGNPPFLQEFGHQVKRLDDLICQADDLAKIYTAISKQTRFEQDLLMRTQQGETWYHLIAVRSENEQGDATILLNHYNIHKRKTIELNLRKEAWSDPLTGLLNRRGLSEFLANNIENQTPFTLLYIDLDGFKMINDSLGHAIGDDILVEVANRLRQFDKQAGIQCRFGGDEFVFAIENSQLIGSKRQLAQRIIDALSQPYKNVTGKSLTLSASIGLASFPGDGQSIEQLISCADAAMYEAKLLGKKRHITYQKGMEHGLKRTSSVAQKLSNAVENQELKVFYQPIFNMDLERISSFEALLHWHNDDLGIVSPDETIRVAEETGLIHSIENWVIEQAIKDLPKLRAAVHDEITMAVNICSLHMADPKLPSKLTSLLSKHHLQPEDLTVELTESVLLKNIHREQNPAQKITAQGIKLSIDDFGTGYSSLAYLHAIPATTVKVDKLFLQQAENNTVSLECIHRLVSSLNMQSLIEGIETKQQAERLQKLGFNLQQGYYHGKPCPLEHYLSAPYQAPHNKSKRPVTADA